MVEWKETMVPYLMIAIGFLFVANSLILFQLEASKDSVLASLGIGLVLVLPTTLALRFRHMQFESEDTQRKEV